MCSCSAGAKGSAFLTAGFFLAAFFIGGAFFGAAFPFFLTLVLATALAEVLPGFFLAPFAAAVLAFLTPLAEGFFAAFLAFFGAAFLAGAFFAAFLAAFFGAVFFAVFFLAMAVTSRSRVCRQTTAAIPSRDADEYS